MDGYHVALFIHFCALIGAVAASAILHLAAARRDRAGTVAELLAWHKIVIGASKTFPIALVAFVLTGSYMIRGGSQVWSSGFVVSGLTGVALLFVFGIVVSMKGRAMKQRLEQIVRDGGGNQPPSIAPDSVAAVLQNIPVGIVLAVVFDMTTKPNVGSALGVIGLGIALGAVVGLLHRPAPAASKALDRR